MNTPMERTEVNVVAHINPTIAHEVDSLRLVDTHEHLMPEAERQAQPLDFFYLFPHYASSDLISAGMPYATLERIRDPKRPLEERWAEFAPYWPNVRTTGYGKSLLRACQGLFGVDDINENTYLEVSERLAASNRPGWYHYVLKDKARIDVSIIDSLSLDGRPITEVDRDVFAPVVRFDKYVTPTTRSELRLLEDWSGLSIHSLDDLLGALDSSFEKAVKGGAVGVKSGLAYLRILSYDKVSRHEAEACFNRIFSHLDPLRESSRPSPSYGLGWAEAKPLQDYMMHQVIRRAIDYGLPLQIHTGLQEGNSNVITNSNPTHLVNLLIEYPEARFDLFHAGYPYTSEMATIGKNFANAYVDLCWVHIISPFVARRVLHEWLETVPANKIFAFGGDYIVVEGAYGHAEMARDNVARVLSEKVEEGYFTEDEAIRVARQILRDNPASLFRLPL